MTWSSIDFLSESPPEHYTLAFEPFLYNQEAYLQLKEGRRYSFYMVDHTRQQVLARIHFVLVSDATGSQRAVSLPESPFGSVEFGISVASSTLSDFMMYVIDELKMLSVNAIEIRDCIDAYRPSSNGLLEYVFHSLGFRKQEVLTNHHIPVDQEQFSDKIHAMERRRIRKCKQAGFVARQETLSNIQYFYSFILGCRQERGWGLSMSADEIQRTVAHFPASYKIFAVYDQQTCIAASLVVQVNGTILYNFFPAMLLSYRPYSPMVMLLAEIYHYCYAQQIKLLDLGTSSQESLRLFKVHVSGISSEKNTLVLDCLSNKTVSYLA